MAAIRAHNMVENNGLNGEKGTWGSPDSSNQEVSWDKLGTSFLCLYSFVEERAPPVREAGQQKLKEEQSVECNRQLLLHGAASCVAISITHF